MPRWNSNDFETKTQGGVDKLGRRSAMWRRSTPEFEKHATKPFHANGRCVVLESAGLPPGRV
jgi:hypothetical protein